MRNTKCEMSSTDSVYDPIKNMCKNSKKKKLLKNRHEINI